MHDSCSYSYILALARIKLLSTISFFNGWFIFTKYLWGTTRYFTCLWTVFDQTKMILSFKGYILSNLKLSFSISHKQNYFVKRPPQQNSTIPLNWKYLANWKGANNGVTTSRRTLQLKGSVNWRDCGSFPWPDSPANRYTTRDDATAAITCVQHTRNRCVRRTSICFANADHVEIIIVIVVGFNGVLHRRWMIFAR